MRNRDGKIPGIYLKVSLFFLLFTVHCSLFTVPAESAGNGELMEQIRQAVLKDLSGSISGNIEISGLRIAKGADLLNSASEYKIESVVIDGYSGRNKMNYIVTLSDKKSGLKSLTAEASFDMLADVYISTRTMSKGTVLTAEDFFATKLKGSKLPAGTIKDRKDFEGKMLKAAIGQGVVLRADHMTSDLTVKRGQKVEVKIESDSLTVAAKGVLKSDAVIGGAAKVMCDVSKKEVNGVLVNSNTVKVKI